MGRIMGIDYGLRRTGISVTDPLKIIVRGLETQDTKSVLSFIVAYSRTEQLDEIVVGYPFVEGAFGDKKFKKALDQFITDLRKAFPDIPVSMHDERFISMEAKSIMHEGGWKKRKREDKAMLDQMSAILILQQYLKHI